jgi:Flp pilus assembly protein TadB
MDTLVILLIVLGVGATAAGGWLFYIFYFSGNSANASNLRSASRVSKFEDSSAEEGFKKAREVLSKKKKSEKKTLTIEEKFFQAGIVTLEQKKKFKNLQTFAPIIGAIIVGYVGSTIDLTYGLLGLVLGGLAGLQLPNSILDRKIAARSEDIMFYLPLVIEQIAIGVSSSLDIGPCLQKVVTMADERDSHNVVTEFLKLVITMAKTGISLEDCLLEVGRKSGHLELNQTFGALGQVVRHGGEITKQLQEMADAVSTQRETKIEAKIKKLELEATGPVALVFMGFLLILLTCIGMQMLKAFA